jgi:23S rRNA pseudouridine1911/1915/1917 synthase
VSQAFVVTPAEAGRTLAAVLKERLGVSWSQARRLVELRCVRLAGQTCGDAVRRVRTGQRVEVVAERGRAKSNGGPAAGARPAIKKPKITRAAKSQARPAGAQPVVRYVDDSVVVVDKPRGMTTHRSSIEAAEFGSRAKRFLPPTLADRLPALLPDAGSVRAVHRIDRDTSGLVVFARTPEAEANLGRQFRAHTVGRRYLAITRGRPAQGRIESWLVRDRGDGRRGGGPAAEGQRAVTHVRVVEELGPCCLVECRLETGRTHQVRIHLGEAGAPLAGERVYDRPPHGAPAPDPSGSPRIALHAAYLGFKHPATGKWMEWESTLPEDLQAVLLRLRTGLPAPGAQRGGDGHDPDREPNRGGE